MDANLATRTTKARKPHQCIWCGGIIGVAELYVKDVGVYAGDFYSNSWHTECLESRKADYSKTKEVEFTPYDNGRPTIQVQKVV